MIMVKAIFGFDDLVRSFQPVLMILVKVYPSHNRCKQSVLMIPAKVYPSHNRCKQPVLMIPTKAIFTPNRACAIL